jgi:hypothetical protein
MTTFRTGVTSPLACIVAVALLDPWRERRRGVPLTWAPGVVSRTDA